MTQTLSLRLREQREKEAAWKRFKEAVASRDVSQLRAFLQEAKFRGWDKEGSDSVQSAQELLEELEQQAKAQKDLATAMKAPIDEQALQKALEAAEATGVGKRELAEGRRLLEAEWKRTAAKDSLEMARLGSHPATLQAAISQGEQAGLSQNELSAAKERLSELEKVLKNQGLAKQELRDAMDSQDPKDLREAIRFGQEAGLSEKELAGASVSRNNCARIKHKRILNWHLIAGTEKTF